MKLTIDNYNRAESLADIPTPVWMAFSPHTFQETRFPTHIVHPRQLIRYADTNNEEKTPYFYTQSGEFPRAAYKNGFTHDEVDLMESVRERIAATTQENCGRAVMPMTNLLAQTGPFRFFNSTDRKLRIFEIGPGCGYLGAMLMLQGVHSYWSTDITQGLYLWQSLVMNAMGEHHEGAVTTQTPTHQFAHIPYWTFVSWISETCPKFDIVYSNNNLAEMHPLARAAVLYITKRMLKDDGFLLYFAPGHKQFEGWEQSITQIGFSPIESEIANAFNVAGKTKMRFALDPYNPSGRGGNIDAGIAVATKANLAPIDVTWSRLFTGWNPPVT